MATTRQQSAKMAADSAKGKAISEEGSTSTIEVPPHEEVRTSYPILDGISWMPSSLHPPSLPPHYAFQPMPMFPSQPSTTLPPLSSPFPHQPSPSYNLQAPILPPNLSLPTLSDAQKLTSTNYPTWSIFMQLLLESVGVWQSIANPSMVHPSYQSIVGARAKTLLIHGMSPSLVPQYLSLGMTAQGLWHRLYASYGRVSSVKLAKLEEDLDNLHFGESDDMVEKLGEFNSIKHQLEELGSNVSNPVHKLLGKLPSSFESFKDNIYLCVPFPSFDEAVGLLHDKFISRKPRKHNNFAFIGNSSSKGSSNNAKNTKKDSKSKGNKPQASSTQAPRKECSFCGMTNHTEATCNKKEQASKAAKEAVKASSPSNKHKKKDKKDDSKAKVAYVACKSLPSTHVSNVLISSPSSKELEEHVKEEWISNSGASAHMSHSSSHMEDYKASSSHVRIEDDSSLSVLGMGKVTFGDASLHDLLHVPHLSSNLFSISKATSKGLGVYFDDEVVEVIDRASHSFVAHGTQRGVDFASLDTVGIS
ncbi:hypothetical protein L7F22_001510 [Adiantum nelumboides]|nr:hypothetical protein [Adiantum nelumboides]